MIHCVIEKVEEKGNLSKYIINLHQMHKDEMKNAPGLNCESMKGRFFYNELTNNHRITIIDRIIGKNEDWEKRKKKMNFICKSAGLYINMLRKHVEEMVDGKLENYPELHDALFSTYVIKCE